MLNLLCAIQTNTKLVMVQVNELKSFGVNSRYVKPIIVFDIMYAPSDDKKTDWEKFQEKYDKLFEGYTVVYIDSSKHNTMSNNQVNNPPIYKL